MKNNQSVTVIMPGRSVAKILENQIKLIPDFVDEIILISNKSRDDTLEVAERLSSMYPNFRYVVDNRADADGIGYGFAIQTGLKEAKGDLVFKIDADCTYPVEELESIIEHMQEKNLKLVSCNRYPVKKESDVHWFNQIGVKSLNLAFRVLTGYKIKDILSGFYGGDRKLISSLAPFNEGGWNMSVEIKYKFISRYRHQFGEFHISQKSAQTSSHQKYIQTGWRHLTYIIQNCF
jgi:glycosyltransferase involved in cell wall biosynthesis